MTLLKKIPSYCQEILNRYCLELSNSEGGEGTVFGTMKEWSYQSFLYLHLSDLFDQNLLMQNIPIISSDVYKSIDHLPNEKTRL